MDLLSKNSNPRSRVRHRSDRPGQTFATSTLCQPYISSDRRSQLTDRQLRIAGGAGFVDRVRAPDDGAPDPLLQWAEVPARLRKDDVSVPRFSRGPTGLRQGTDLVCAGQASSGATLAWATGVGLVITPAGVWPVKPSLGRSPTPAPKPDGGGAGRWLRHQDDLARPVAVH